MAAPSSTVCSASAATAYASSASTPTVVSRLTAMPDWNNDGGPQVKRRRRRADLTLDSVRVRGHPGMLPAVRERENDVSEDAWLRRRTALHDRYLEVAHLGDASRLAYLHGP